MDESSNRIRELAYEIWQDKIAPTGKPRNTGWQQNVRY
jgi:hypothetical protein